MTDESRYESCTNRSRSGSSGRSPSCDQALVALPKCTDVTSRTFQIEEQLNALFEKRLHEINEEANGDASLKERTYKEWIAMLRDINKTCINNIHDIENDATILQQSAGTNQDSELCKCRKDIAALIELVRNGRQYGDWNVDKFKFETVTERDIFGDGAFSNILMRDDIRNDCNKPSTNADPKSCASQKSKLVANVKALAYEVADKHDEIRELKKQILSMEDEIQKAQKKIQLKDDVIRELRSDLKSLPKCNQVCGPRILDRTTSNIGCTDMCGTEGSSTPRAGSVYSNRGSMDMVFGLNLGEDEDDGEDYVLRLKDELNQFFEAKQVYDQNIEEQGRELKEQQDRLSDMVDKLLKKNNCFQMKLRVYRHELMNLEIPQTTSTFTFCSDKDSGINSTDSDMDLKILSSVRNRIACLNEENARLKKEEECLQIKYKESSSKFLAKSMLLEKTSQTLREVVDALSQAICSPIAYDIIFSEKTSSTNNPIVDALDVFIKSVREKDVTINELRKQISSAGHANEELELDCQNLKSELCNLKQSV